MSEEPHSHRGRRRRRRSSSSRVRGWARDSAASVQHTKQWVIWVVVALGVLVLLVILERV